MLPVTWGTDKLTLSVTQQAGPCLGYPPFPAQFLLTLGINSASWGLSLAPSCLLYRSRVCFFLVGYYYRSLCS